MSSEVEQWLRKFGLETYKQVFADNNINLDLLPQLTDTDLKELGLTVGHRVIFRRAAERLKGGGGRPVAAEGPELGPAEFAGERKLISVLFCDIVDSTRLSSLIDAEELDDVLQAFFTRCATIVQSFGGLLAAKLGDGAVCWFGWPQAHEDDPLRAVHAALMVAHEIPTIQVLSSPDWRLNVRIGVATGHVVTRAAPGAEIPQIVGETPTRAERLKAACPIGSVVIDPATRKLVGANFEILELGAQPLKGFDEPIEIYQVTAPLAGVSRFEGSHPGAPARRLVGRHGDMAMLKSRWELARQGEGQVAVLTGQAGIGKSRLATAFADQIRAEGPCQVQVYQCSHLYQNTELYPVISRIMRDAEIKLLDKPDEKLRKLHRLPDVESSPNAQAAGLFASLLSIPPHEGFEPPSMRPEDWRAAMFEAILEAVSRLSERTPVLLIVEDVHWIDPTSLELLDAIVARSPTLPVLVLMTSRGEELTGRWTEADNITHLQVSRLSPSQSREYCEEIIGTLQMQLHGRLAGIVKAAQGVPLFLEELAKYAQENPAVRDPEKEVRQEGRAPSTKIPDQLFSLLAERLDRLDGQMGAKRVAQTAAVFGDDFSLVLLAQVPSLQKVENIQAAVDQLLNAGLVVRSEGAVQGLYSFRHSIFREVAYASLLRSTRRLLHGEIATLLVEAGVAEVEPGIVAYHFTEAQRPKEAIAHWTRAGLRSNERSAISEAFNHFSRGLELISQLPDEKATHELELPLRVGFGAVASAIESYSAQDIEKNYTRMLVLAETLNRPRERFRAHLGLGAFYEADGDIQRSQVHCEECLRSAEQSGARDELLHAHRLMGELKFYKGEFASATAHFETALSLYDAKDHLKLIRGLGDDPGVLSRVYNALSLWFLGFPDRAREDCELGLQLASKLGHAFTSLQADVYAAWLHALTRDFQRSKSLAEAALERSTDQPFALVPGFARVIKGWAMAQMNERAAGEAELLHGIDIIRGPLADICESAFLTFLADHHLMSGNLEEGLSVVREARTKAREHVADSDRLRLHGELMIASDAQAAERLLRDAMARALEQKSLSMALRSALSLYRFLDKLGQAEEGKQLLQTVYGQFTEGFETSDLREAGAILKAGKYAHQDA